MTTPVPAPPTVRPSTGSGASSAGPATTGGQTTAPATAAASPEDDEAGATEAPLDPDALVIYSAQHENLTQAWADTFSAANGGVPVTGELFLTVEAHSRDGLIARQLGIEVRDGDGVAAYVATSPTAEALRLDDAVHVADGEVHAAFPLAYVRDLGDGWSWHAMAGVGAAADDFCPGGAGTTEESVASIIVG